MNPPLCTVTLVLGARGLPRRHRPGALAGFDAPGAVLIAVTGGGIVALGSSHALAASPVWAPLVMAGALAAAAGFVHAERRAASPLIPPGLFAVPALARSITVTGLTGIALFGTFTFIPLAVEAGTGASGGQTGTLLLALTLGQLTVTATFAVLARRHPRLTAWGRLGLLMGVAGLLLMAAVPLLPRDSSPLPAVLAVAGMAMAGAALGLSMQAYTLIGQATAPRDSFGAAMGALTFARQLGGSLGAAAFGWLLLTIPGNDRALAVVLAAAAAITAAAVPIAPHREQPPPGASATP